MTENKHKHLLKNKMPFMISCDEASFLISKNQHETIGLKNKLKLKMHLLMCIYCRRYKKQIDFLDKIIQKVKSIPDLSSNRHKLTTKQKEKISQSIKNQENKQ